MRNFNRLHYIIFQIIVSAVFIFPQDSVLTEIGRWEEGPCYTVRPAGNYMAVGNGSLLQIIDFNDPSNPILIGEVPTESIIRDMEVKGNYIFKIFPFQVIDVSDPATPKIVYTDTIGFADTKIMIEGNYAYIGDFVGYIYIIDISNPLNPQRLGTMLASGEDVLSIAVKGNYLYTSTWASFLIDIFDISDKNNPKFISSYSTASSAPFLKIENNLLIEAGGSSSGFKIIDISNAPILDLLGTVSIGHDVFGITLADTLVYLTGTAGNSLTFWGVLTILNIADINHPKVISTTQINNPYFGSGQHFLKDRNIFIPVGRGLTILNVDNLLTPNQIGYYATAFETHRIKVKGNYAFVASDYVGLKVVDFSNPSKPKTVGEFITNQSVYDIALAGNVIYLYGDNALISIDISDPLAPKKIGEINILAPDVNAYLEYNTMTSFDHYVFTTFRDSSITVFDVSDPSNMIILGKFNTSVRSTGLGVVQSEDTLIIYSAEVDSGLQIYAAKLPIDSSINFSKIKFINKILPIVGLTIYQNRLYLASTGLEIFDIVNPQTPVELGRIDTPGGRVTVEIASDNKYSNLAYGGYLICVDVSDPYSPKIIDIINDNVTRNVSIFNNLVFLGTYLNGMKIYENKLITNVKDNSDKNVFHEIKLFQNFPNPFNPETTIKFILPYSDNVELKIYNLLGEEIIPLINSYYSKGEHQINWDASKFSSGVYFYKLKTTQYSETKKLLLLK